jgi:ATP-dependent Clp protease ATP-binding subunit ClpB
VRRRPYSVVLFDEIEKAHPEVFNVLLQILDDGRLTDGHGRTVNFKNTVVIMTSNIGSELWGSEAARQRGNEEQVYSLTRNSELVARLRQHFRPEFLNRVDEIIVFHSLTMEDLVRIVDIQLERLRKLLAERKIGLELTEAAKRYLAEKGYDPVYGARPLKRTIQRELQDPLALKILEGEFDDGDVVMAEVKDGELAFAKQQGRSTAPLLFVKREEMGYNKQESQ